MAEQHGYRFDPASPSAAKVAAIMNLEQPAAASAADPKPPVTV